MFHGGKYLVRRTSLRVLQRAVAILGGKITQQLLKSMIAKWLPILGAGAIAAWSNYSTRRIGKLANTIFLSPIELSTQEVDEKGFTELERKEILFQDQESVGNSSLTILRITALINLMKVDQKLHQSEEDYVRTLITQANISESDKADLLSYMAGDVKRSIDFAMFSENVDEATGLLLDMITLGKWDGDLHAAEKIYIKQAAKRMGIDEGDVDEAFALSE